MEGRSNVFSSLFMYQLMDLWEKKPGGILSREVSKARHFSRVQLSERSPRTHLHG